MKPLTLIENVRYENDLLSRTTGGFVLAKAETGLSDSAFRLLARLHEEAKERLKISRVPLAIEASEADAQELLHRNLFRFTNPEQTDVVLLWR